MDYLPIYQISLSEKFYLLDHNFSLRSQQFPNWEQSLITGHPATWLDLMKFGHLDNVTHAY